jgi:hypothetical protein
MNLAFDLNRHEDSRKLKCEDCVRALRALGFTLEGMTPIRVVMKRDRAWAYVPRHGRISGGELEAILSAARVDAEDFEKALVGIAPMAPISTRDYTHVSTVPPRG